MGKTKKRETKKRETKKRKKTQRGGRPNFIKMYAQHTDKGNVVYRFVYDDFDKEDQKRIFNEDRVYYSVKNDDSLLNEMKNQIDVLNEEARSFFYKKPLTGKPEYKTIIIRNKKELNKIKIADQIIKNMDSVTRTSTTNYDSDTSGFIKEYKKFIKDNETALLTGVSKNTGEKMLNTPAFLNIIGVHYGFITTELPDDLDELKEQMDSPVAPSSSSSSASSSSSSSSSSSTTCSLPKIKSRDISKRLKLLLYSKP
jgi:hypothetical protein